MEATNGPLGELIARAVLDNPNTSIVPNMAGPARLVPLTTLAEEEFSMAALRQAAQPGRLDAVQGSPPSACGAAPARPLLPTVTAGTPGARVPRRNHPLRRHARTSIQKPTRRCPT